jgi:ribose/xylose/arabinose/galactoside ABC-type transport system permease subunit
MHRKREGNLSLAANISRVRKGWSARVESFGGRGTLLRTITRKYGTVIGGILIFIGFSLSTPYFLTTHNFFLMLKHMSMLTILSLGFTFVMGAGGFDMSIGYSIGLVSVFLGSVLNVGDLYFAIPAALMTGLLIGLINGLLVAYLKLPDFIATFAVGSIAFGAKMLYTGGHPVFLKNPSKAFNFIGQGDIGPIPFPVIIMLVILGITLIVLNRTRFGKHIYAIGGNPQAALYVGINIRFYRFLTFLISGLSIAITAIVLTSRLGSAQPQAGEAYLLDVFAVCFLSTTMFGEGEPTAAGAFVGAFIITMLNSGLVMLGVPYHIQYITKGVVVILAVMLSVALGQRVRLKIF